jgi:simple sugar transport system permease protein
MLQNLIEIIFTANFGYAVLRVTTPILFAALGALISSRAGVINISLEGTMLTAALVGVVFSGISQSPWIGLMAAVLAGMLMGLTIAFFSLNLKTDIILAGIALNLMAGGGTIFALFVVSGDRGISSSIRSHVLPMIRIPYIQDTPVIGRILSGHNVLTYMSIIAVVVIYYLVYKTPLGLRIRAVGENSHAADSVGISVNKVQYIALIISGALAGFGGAYMSMGYVSWFSTNMTAGRGFIAMAANALGMATPFGVLLTSLLFGFADALSNSLHSLRIPSQFVQMIPYVATILGLLIYSIQQTSKANRIRKEQKV